LRHPEIGCGDRDEIVSNLVPRIAPRRFAEARIRFVHPDDRLQSISATQFRRNSPPEVLPHMISGRPCP
jgi:hypothetical protein